MKWHLQNHKGFIQAYTLMLFSMILSFCLYITYQVETYIQAYKNSEYIDLYAIKEVKEILKKIKFPIEEEIEKELKYDDINIHIYIQDEINIYFSNKAYMINIQYDQHGLSDIEYQQMHVPY